MYDTTPKSVAIIVAHPDDEILWVGGTILTNPSWKCFIVSLCRKYDTDRAAKFYKVLNILNANGVMGNLDDEPEQIPLENQRVEQAIMDLLPQNHFDLMITHNPFGEYTRHLRHEEISKAVIHLWQQKVITTDAIWFFAYEDGKKKYFPRPMKNANYYETLNETIWLKKYDLITKIYGFDKDSWEAKTTPKVEAFWQFTHAPSAVEWMNK